MNLIDEKKAQLKQQAQSWLVTGCAGFIGSHLLETLLKLDQHVIGLDNFSTGYRHNLDDVKLHVSAKQWDAFKFYEGDIRKIEDCKKASEGVQIILHQAALGSVPRSIADPVTTNANNIDGFLNMLVAAKDASVKRFVYAASSSTYGDHPALPKKENVIGRPLSPYAVTKYVNELYAEVFARIYGLDTIGLRYFNVFGPRQDPKGAYAAVIPKWFLALIMNETVYINGDGETSRDFCFIENCVQANILAATTENEDAINQVYNVAVGQRTSLNELFKMIKQCVSEKIPEAVNTKAVYRDFRHGDVRHSLAGLDKAINLLRYAPKITVEDGLRRTTQRYFNVIKDSD